MRIADYMTDNDVKLSMGNKLTPEQAALWQQAFAAGNRQFEASDMSEDEVVRWKYQRYIKTYLASVQSMDRQIGRLLDYLQQQGLLENTLIVYSSDQGFFLGENGWFDKRWMDEVSSRVPLLMQWPGHIRPGTTSDALVQNIDFAPTLLAAAGVTPEKPMHGVSLLPLFVAAAANRGSATCTTTFTKIPASTVWRATTACAPSATSWSTTTRTTSGNCSTW